MHRAAVDAVALEPAAVVGEVLADRADEQRTLTEVGHAERDVRGDPAPADLQVRGEERQGDLVELLDDERVGEESVEGHEVVGGDGTGDGDLHSTNLPGIAAPPTPARRRPDDGPVTAKGPTVTVGPFGRAVRRAPWRGRLS